MAGGKQRTEIGVRADQNSRLRARRLHHHGILRGLQTQGPKMDDIPTGGLEQTDQALRQVGVEQQPHAEGRSGSWRSRTVSAANRSASTTSAAVRSGRSSRISSVVIPSATIVTTVATGMRNPLMVGTPPISS